MTKIKLFPHQQKTLEMTRGINKVAYYLDMGLGKTFVATEKAKELEANIILVVCQKSKLKDWEEHFNEFYPEYEIISYKKQLLEIKDNTVIIINYDLIWRIEEFKKLKKFTLILDESSYIKSETSNRTKFILKLKPTNVILLSGTPIGGKYEELYSQIKLLGWKIKKEDYWNNYIKFFMLDIGGFKKRKVTGYKNVHHLQQMLRQHGAIFMKTEDVINLPEIVEYELKIKNIPQYERFKKDRLIEVEGNELVGDTTLTKLLYMRQLSAMYNKNKYEKVIELLESTEDRIIIFYNFKYEFQKLQEICKRLKKLVSIVNGDTRDLKNYEQNDDSITLIQYQAGAMGLNLQRANKIIYFSFPLSSELFEQSKKRTHRLGQQRACFYYYLITEKSIEMEIFNTLKERKDYTDKLFEECERQLI